MTGCEIRLSRDAKKVSRWPLGTRSKRRVNSPRSPYAPPREQYNGWAQCARKVGPNGFFGWLVVVADKSLKTKVEARAPYECLSAELSCALLPFPLTKSFVEQGTIHCRQRARRHPGVCWLATKQCQSLALASFKLAARWIFFFFSPPPLFVLVFVRQA